jgi:hypothetical protein
MRSAVALKRPFSCMTYRDPKCRVLQPLGQEHKNFTDVSGLMHTLLMVCCIVMLSCALQQSWDVPVDTGFICDIPPVPSARIKDPAVYPFKVLVF